MRLAAALIAIVLAHTPAVAGPLNAARPEKPTATPHLRFVFPTQDGFVGIGPGWIWRSTDARLFHAVLPYDRSLLRAVAFGDRLVLAHQGGVDVVTVGETSRVERAPFTDAIGPEWTMAGPLAVGNAQALALTARRAWRLGLDGKWTSSAHGIPDELHRLAYASGVWVAAGVRPGSTERAPRKLALWWSKDGTKWTRATIDPVAGAGTFDDEVAVAFLLGNGQGFLVVTSQTTGLVSVDGSTWAPVTLPPVYGDDGVQAAAGQFWIYTTRLLEKKPVQTSVDGRTWQPQALPPGATIDAVMEKNAEVWIYTRCCARQSGLVLLPSSSTNAGVPRTPDPAASAAIDRPRP